MKTYRVLIADDEYLIMRGLRLLIDWEKYNCVIVGEAQDGKQCLEMIEALRADIVITDIRMPKMSGIEMILAAQKFPRTKFIILSGYSDFEYARQCMALGVQEYLLKPVEEEALIESLLRVQRQLERMSTQHKKLQSIMEKNERNELRFRDIFLRDFVNSYFDQTDDIRTLLANEGILIPEGSAYCCMLIEVLGAGDALFSFRAGMKRIFQEEFGDRFILFIYEEDRYMALLSLKWAQDSETLAARMDALKEKLQRETGRLINAGLGNCYAELHKIYLSSRQARMAISFQMLHEESAAPLSPAPPPRVRQYAMVIPNALMSPLFSGLSRFSVAEVNESLRKIFTYLEETGGAEPPGIQINALNILLLCINYIEEIDAFEGAARYETRECYDQIAGMTGIKQIFQYVAGTIENLINSRGGADVGKLSKLIRRVQDYVRGHVYEDVSLVSVAQAFYVSPVYLSRIFKREVGMLYIDYVTSVKMDAAKYLIQTTDMRIYEVANRLGYKDAKYFSQLFRNKWGKNPSDYHK